MWTLDQEIASGSPCPMINGTRWTRCARIGRWEQLHLSFHLLLWIPNEWSTWAYWFSDSDESWQNAKKFFCSFLNLCVFSLESMRVLGRLSLWFLVAGHRWADQRGHSGLQVCKLLVYDQTCSSGFSDNSSFRRWWHRIEKTTFITCVWVKIKETHKRVAFQIHPEGRRPSVGRSRLYSLGAGHRLVQ